MTNAYTLLKTDVFEVTPQHIDHSFFINISLPLSYRADGTAYPLVLALDADAAFALMSGILHLLEMEQRIPPVILAAIGYGVPFLHPGNRRNNDYPPTQAHDPTETAGPSVVGGGAPHLLKFIREELMPLLAERYPLDLKTTVFSGVSFGGLFGTYTLLHQPEAFSHYLIGSPSLWWDDRVCFRFLNDYASGQLPARVFFSVGEEEVATEASPFHMVQDLTDFVAQLRERNLHGLELQHIVHYGGHLSSQPGALVQGLTYLLGSEGKTAATSS